MVSLERGIVRVSGTQARLRDLRTTEGPATTSRARGRLGLIATILEEVPDSAARTPRGEAGAGRAEGRDGPAAGLFLGHRRRGVARFRPLHVFAGACTLIEPESVVRRGWVGLDGEPGRFGRPAVFAGQGGVISGTFDRVLDASFPVVPPVLILVDVRTGEVPRLDVIEVRLLAA